MEGGGGEQWIEDVDLEHLDTILPDIAATDFRDIQEVLTLAHISSRTNTHTNMPIVLAGGV